MQGGGSKNSNIASGSSSGSNKATGDKEQCPAREQDLFLPIANMLRIMRKVLPAHAKISDDSKETIQECVSEFIMFVTSEANDKCRIGQRKTVTADDLLWAIAKLGFHDYVHPLYPPLPSGGAPPGQDGPTTTASLLWAGCLGLKRLGPVGCLRRPLWMLTWRQGSTVNPGDDAMNNESPLCECWRVLF